MSNRYESELSAFQDEVWSSLEKYGRKLGWGLSGIQPENWILLDHAVDELVKLRDQLRWRKWPEEKPEHRGRYLVLTDGTTGIGNHVSYYSAGIGWATSDAGISHWRPIGPIPGGE
jgi:hypothetical protein